MRVLAFDQSIASTAAVVMVSDETNKLTIEHIATIKPKSSGIYRLAYINHNIDDIVRAARPDLLVREMHHQVQYGAASQIQVVGGLIDLIARHHHLLEDKKYVAIPATTWKKFVAGKGNLKKDTAYLVHINAALKRCKVFNAPADQVQDDIADAICLGITGYVAKAFTDPIKNIQLVSMFGTKPFTPQTLDTMFNYGEATV